VVNTTAVEDGRRSPQHLSLTIASGVVSPRPVGIMANQESVKDIYLKVIEATIAGSRAEFEEANSADESLLATLDILRERWQAGLLESHDFSEDPSASIRTSNPRGSAANKASASGTGAATHGQRHRQAAARAAASAEAVKAEPGIVADGNGADFDPALASSENSQAQASDQAMSGSGFGGASQQQSAVGVGASLRRDGFAPVADASSMPGVPRRDGVLPGTLQTGIPSAGGVGGAGGAATGNIPQGDGTGGSSSGGEEPAAKRARHDEEQVNANEDLGSEDSDDDQSDGSEGEWDNFIVAQHDSVKKGGGNGKWKVRLKDGILHLHGREYLFSKASCDLDW
jgi:Transcription factor IIA, alpha/beta subunit